MVVGFVTLFVRFLGFIFRTGYFLYCDMTRLVLESTSFFSFDTFVLSEMHFNGAIQNMWSMAACAIIIHDT